MGRPSKIKRPIKAIKTPKQVLDSCFNTCLSYVAKTTLKGEKDTILFDALDKEGKAACVGLLFEFTTEYTDVMADILGFKGQNGLVCHANRWHNPENEYQKKYFDMCRKALESERELTINSLSSEVERLNRAFAELADAINKDV